MMDSRLEKVSWPGWNVVRRIGSGSFGAVYEIERKVFARTEKAALKVITIPQSNSDIDDLYSDGYDSESITQRYQSYLEDIVREYSLMAEMKGNTNVVYCDDFRYDQHRDGIGWDIYIKMELLTPLVKTLPKNIPDEMAIRLGIDICNALVLCKKRSIIHRDIKPQNIFVSQDGNYKLGDFGIAKAVERTTSGTKTGTYKYMAPEVYNNEPYGSAADIYSLGLVLYWLLNERRTPFLPMPPETPTVWMEDEARERRLHGEKIPAPKHGSEALKAIVLKACAYDPKERYADPAEMREELETVLYGHEFPKKELETIIEEPDPVPEIVEEPVEGEIVGPEIPAGNDEELEDVTEGPEFFSGVKYEPEEDRPEGPADSETVGPEIGLGVKNKPKDDEPEGSESGGTVGPVKPEAKQKKKLSGWILVAASMLIIAACAILLELEIPQKTSVIAESPSSNAVDVASSEPSDETTNEPDYSYLVVTTASNLRSGPGTDYDIITTVEVGTILDTVLEKVGDWYKVWYGDRECFIREDLVLTPQANTVIDGGTYHSVGLLSNGTVVTAGNNNDGCCEVSNWKDIVSISAGSSHTVGLRTDGTVVATGWNENGCCDVDGWTDIVAVSAGHGMTLGLRADGTVVAAGADIDSDFSQWSDIIAISTDGTFSIGLKSDGTVVGTGPLEWNGFNIDGWKDLVAVESGTGFWGIKADGTVLTTGQLVPRNTTPGWNNISNEWHDIVAIEAKDGHAVGLRADGTVVATGNNDYGQCNTETWTDIVAIGVGWHHTIGVKSDGTVVAVGRTEYGACDVSDWSNIYTE